MTPTTGYGTAIGDDSSGSGNGWFDGLIDEVQFSDIARSADWIKQNYEMVENQGTHVTTGSEASR